MSPLPPDQPTPSFIPPHDHTRRGEGGVIPIVRSDGSAVIDGTVTCTGLTVNGATALASLGTTPIQSTIDGFICTDGAETMTDARDWKRPDASGDYVVSKPLVTLVDKATTQTGNVLVAPEAGHYAFLVYVENVTALAAGTVLAAITHVGRGGSCTQSPLPALVLTAAGAQSFVVVCKVASGDVTYAFTVAAAVGTPSFDASVIPLGRIG